MKYLLSKLPALILAGLFLAVASSQAFAQVNIVIFNDDAPGVGFNDTTPAAPVGGNSGTTIGQQRLIAFQNAASIWGAGITSTSTILIRSRWLDMSSGCTANAGTLGSAGPNSARREVSGGLPGHWYPIALANALAASDLNGPTHEINAQFNLSLGTPGCLQNLHWYYGLDGNETSTGVDLVAVLLHEFGHGLGFSSLTDTETGVQAGSQASGFFPTIFDRFLFDKSTNKTWPQMTDAERVASAINDRNLVWNGPQVTTDSGLLTFGKDTQGHPWMFAPNPHDEGSSVSHWDNDASPNQLMEPSISRSLSHSVRVPQDLTLSLLKDIGWPTGPPPPPPPAPANDNFASAQALSGCSGTVNGSNISATKEAGEPAHWPASALSTKSVWYQWQAVASQSVTISTVGSNYDTILAVYTGNSVNGLTLVPGGSNDDIASGNTASSVTFTANAGTIYRIAVDGFDNGGSGGDTGNIVLNWNQSNCTVVGPTIFVEQGTNVVAAVDSVTQVKGPFTVMTPNSFAPDGKRRVIFFTTDLGLAAGNTTGLIVRANSTSLPIETAGPFSLISGSYVIVRLDTLTPGTYNLSVTLNGANSTNAPTIQIIP
jgi:hypothetical protein